jgi:hypothetical protein
VGTGGAVVVVVGGAVVVVVAGGLVVVVAGGLVVAVGNAMASKTLAVAPLCGIAAANARSSVRTTCAEKLGACCAVVSEATGAGAASTAAGVVVVVVDAAERGRVVGATSAFTYTEGGAVGRAAYTMIPIPMARKARKAPTIMRRSLIGPLVMFSNLSSTVRTWLGTVVTPAP